MPAPKDVVGAADAARPVSIGRNRPCPCGSGRKFKFCCHTGDSRARAPAVGAARSSGPVAQPGRGLGPLTEFSGLRQVAEAFHRVSPDFPPGVAKAGAVPPRHATAAERQRQRGARLMVAGRLADAIAAFTRATRLDPRNAAAHRALGRALLDSGRAADAAESLRLATALGDDAAAFCDLGAALRRQRRDVEAVAAYRRAAVLAPDLTEALVSLADLLERLGDYEEEATQFYRRAATLAPHTAMGRLHLARALMIEGDFGAAETELRAAVLLEPESDQLHKLLGDVLVRLGRFEEAVVRFDHVLALNPRQISAYFTIAEARKCSAVDRPRLARMLAALGDPARDDEERLLLHFAAGKMLDDLGDYRTAIAHFDAANRIRGQFASFDGASFVAEIDHLVQRFTPDFYAGSRTFGTDDETPLLIVGMPRSGTTLVEQILSRHPRIGGGGEQVFWIRQATAFGVLDGSYLSPKAGRTLAQEYLSQLRRIAPAAARVTDKLPFNVICVGLVHLLLPKARIIQCRRHPVDTCLSIYFTPFQQAISFSSDKAALATAWRQYTLLMDHWRAVLPAERCLDIHYEELVADREKVTRRLIDFAGLEWHDDCLSPERNPRPVTTASLWQARQPIYTSSVGRWRHYEPWLGELRELLDGEGRDRSVGRP